MKISRAMVMSAGLGTRLRPFTAVESKAILPLLGIPINQFVFEGLVNSGVDTIVVNVHHHAQRVEESVGSYLSKRYQVLFSDERSQLLGSAGGIRRALPLLRQDPPFESSQQGPFFLANSDVLCDISWEDLARQHQNLRSRFGVTLTLAIYPKSTLGGRYREILFDSLTGLISGLGVQREAVPFFVGAAVVESEALTQVPEEGPSDFVEKILQPAIDQRKAGVFLSSGLWFDIGSPDLWFKTHGALLRWLENESPQNARQLEWRKMIEHENVRLSPNIWVSKHSWKGGLVPRSWSGPCYWKAQEEIHEGVRQIRRDSVPSQLGPNAVLYGAPLVGQSLSSGIGFNGHWVAFSGSLSDS